MRQIKVWPHLTIVAVVCAVLAGVGVALWMKHEQTASAESIPNAARIQRVEGEVSLNNDQAGNTQTEDWIRATARGSIQTRRSTCSRSTTVARSSLYVTDRPYSTSAI